MIMAIAYVNLTFGDLYSAKILAKFLSLRALISKVNMVTKFSSCSQKQCDFSYCCGICVIMTLHDLCMAKCVLHSYTT